jgi:hypothetical protein
MKAFFTFVLFLVFYLFSVFAQAQSSQLQIEFDRSMDYIVQIGNFEYKSNGNPLLVDNLRNGFHPVQIYKQERRSRKLLYSGGVNLADNSVTYSNFKRGNLLVQEVVSFEVPQVIVMNDATFRHFKKTVEEESFSSNKMELLENQLNVHYFTAHQIAELVDVLSFDSDQLKFAKMAYVRTADPQNYFSVVEKLKFSSSKKELNQHIQKIQLGK